MKRLLIGGPAVVAAAVVLAGCGGGGSSNSSPTTPRQSSGATVSAKQIGDAGKVLVDSSGQALYMNDQEKGMVLCDGACLSFWTPLTVNGTPKGSSVTGNLGVIKRPDDGAKQVTLDGKPLYTFYLDSPGEVGGDNFADAFGGQKFTWHVAHSGKTTSSSGGGTTQPSGPLGY